MGGLIYQNRDMGGSQYMRNRYYDAATGRFTQEDPIGMAGGLNLYGFAAGDPVNYTDPFGLLDCNKKTGEGCSEEYKRLIGYDQPIETPLIDPVEVVADVASGGLVGVGKVAAEGASEAAAKSAAKATGRKLTRWGWEEGAKHRTAVKQLAKESLSPITHESVGGIIPTAEEATEMIGKGGGKVLRVEAGHAPAVSTHTYPHINYVTKGGTKATVRIQ
jgi:RHS repeat-associated protein